MTQKDLINEYATIYGGEDSRSVEYMKKDNDYIVELSDGKLYAIEKPRIRKDFCFRRDYNGMYCEETEKNADEMAHYARTNVNYFINKNLEPLYNELKRFDPNLITDDDDYYLNKYKWLKPYVVGGKYGPGTEKIAYIQFVEIGEPVKPGARPATNEEIESIINGLKLVIDQFKKRLDTYLKKYGLEKLNIWTYYSD